MKRMISSWACAMLAVGLSSFAAADELFSSIEVRVNPVTHERMMIPEHCSPEGCKSWEQTTGTSQPEQVPSPMDTPSGNCAANACEECCCECPRPCWYFQSEAIWLRRNTPEHFPISFPGSNDPPGLSTDDLRFGDEPGYRFTLGRAIGCESSIEATYFGVRSWRDSQEVIDPNNGLDPFLRVGIQNIANFRNAFSHEIIAGTELHSFEANYRHWLRGNCAWSGSCLAGFRYVHVGDRFDFVSHDTDPALFPDDLGLYSVHTTNDLFGAQLGGTLVRQVSTRLSIGGKFKGGLYANDISQHSQLLNQQSPGGPTTDRQVGRDGTQLATLIETGLFATLQFTPRAGVIAGYDVYNISGLALAPEQLDFTATSFDTGGLLVDNGNLILHGPYVGGWLMW